VHRFFLSADEWNSSEPQLSSEESHHATNVLRLKSGDRITVFDGLGHEATATIKSESGQNSIAIGPRTTSAALKCKITLAQAIPKGKTMDLVIQKAVELGAAKIAPILSERTIVRLDEEEAEKKRLRWQDVALEACKQCGQNTLPEVSTPLSPDEFLKRETPADLMLVASLQPGSRRLHSILEDFQAQHDGKLPTSATILIGPEGDFTPAETAAALSAGCQPVTLGPIILRTETAAIYCLSVLAHELF